MGSAVRVAMFHPLSGLDGDALDQGIQQGQAGGKAGERLHIQLNFCIRNRGIIHFSELLHGLSAGIGIPRIGKERLRGSAAYLIRSHLK